MDKDGNFQISNFKNYFGEYYFRKIGPKKIEYNICWQINQNPHPNIVKFYGINSQRLDMEILDTPFDIANETDAIKLIENMVCARNYLLDNGIVYIDWKLDNIGWSTKDQVFKLFDFDLAGLFNPVTNQWVDEPEKLFAYKSAVECNIFDPIGIDSFSFNKMVDNLLVQY